MNGLPEASPRRVVVAPDVVAKSFHVASCRTILELWRDGRIQLVVARELLVIYLRLLRELSIPDVQLRRWAIWFTAEDKSVFLAESDTPRRSLHEILHDAARRGNAEVIVSTYAITPQTTVEAATGESASWILVEDFLSEYMEESA